MPRRLLNESINPPQKPRGLIGGNERVARLFLPACPASDLIWLEAHHRRRAPSRRSLARLVDMRRVVS